MHGTKLDTSGKGTTKEIAAMKNDPAQQSHESLLDGIKSKFEKFLGMSRSRSKVP